METILHSKITLTLDTYGHLLPDEAAEPVARMPSVEPIPLRLTGTADDRGDDTSEGTFSGSKVPATSTATRVRIGTKQDDPVPPPWPSSKTKNAPGALRALDAWEDQFDADEARRAISKHEASGGRVTRLEDLSDRLGGENSGLGHPCGALRNRTVHPAPY
ncbi:MAG: hypothetical protein AAGA69_07545 [Pseudomonadota bacterium]